MITFDVLSNILFYIFLLTLTAICALFLINIRNIASRFRGIDRRVWLILILILILGSYLRLNSPGCSEQAGLCWSYVNDARYLLDEQKILNFTHPRGYSFLIATGFFLFGMSYHTILYLNLAMSSLVILLVFLLTYLLFGKEEMAIASALVYSLLPSSIIFAVLNASEISSMFFITLMFFIYIISLKEDRLTLYILSLLLLVFSIQIRLDNSVFILVFFFGYFLERKNISFKKLGLSLIVFAIFMISASPYYIDGYDIFGPCGDPEVCKDYPDIFSLNYFIPSLQRHLSYLSVPEYPLLLYVFLFFSLLFIRREKNLIFPLLWISAFFLFYCLYWGALFTGLDIYHVLLHPPFAILMGYGIYRIKDFLEKNVIKFKVPPILKFINTLVMLLLIITLFGLTTNVFSGEKRCVSIMDNLLNVTSGLGRSECILFEDSQSRYNTPRPMRVMEVILPNKHLAMSLEGCGNRSEVYYLYINTINTSCGYSFFGDEKTLFTYLNSSLGVSKVGEDGCVTLYKIEGLV